MTAAKSISLRLVNDRRTWLEVTFSKGARRPRQEAEGAWLPVRAIRKQERHWQLDRTAYFLRSLKMRIRSGWDGRSAAATFSFTDGVPKKS